MSTMTAKERLWLTADNNRLVPEGDPKAATLYAAVGDEIPESAVKQFGLVDGRLKASKKPADDKSKGLDQDKSEKPAGDKDSEPTGGESSEAPGTEKPGITVRRTRKRK